MSAETYFEVAEGEAWLVEDPETGEPRFAENSGWWRIEDSSGNYALTKQVETVGYQNLTTTGNEGFQTFYGDLTDES